MPPSCFPVPLAAEGLGASPGGGGQTPPLPAFSRCPRASVYRRQKPWLQRGTGRHGFQEAPFPRPLRVSHGRLNRAEPPAAARLTGPAGRPVRRPSRRRTRDSPGLCPPGRPACRTGLPPHSPQPQPAAANFAPLYLRSVAMISAPVSTQGSQLTRLPKKRAFFPGHTALTQGNPLPIKVPGKCRIPSGHTSL